MAPVRLFLTLHVGGQGARLAATTRQSWRFWRERQTRAYPSHTRSKASPSNRPLISHSPSHRPCACTLGLRNICTYTRRVLFSNTLRAQHSANQPARKQKKTHTHGAPHSPTLFASMADNCPLSIASSQLSGLNATPLVSRYSCRATLVSHFSPYVFAMSHENRATPLKVSQKGPVTPFGGVSHLKLAMYIS